MPHRRDVLLGGAALLLASGRSHAQSSPEADLAAVLKERVEAGQETMGLVAGRITGGRRVVAAFGRSGAANDRPLDADTVFEIGSITKVFTALLLADMVVRGEVALDDPVAKFLPGGVVVPEFQGVPITLLDLVTYTSGLPRVPDILGRKTRPIPMPIMARTGSTFSWRATSSRTSRASSTNMPISASGCSAMSSR